MKTTLLTLAMAALVLVALPVVAVLALGARYLMPVLLLAGVVVWIASPAFRRWFMTDAEADEPYHGFRSPARGLSLHPGHAWARIGASGRAEVGVDDLIQKVMGPLEAVDVLAPGTTVKQGQRLLTLARGRRRLEVKAPVSGVVREINAAVMARPGLINQAPYQEGWVVRLDAPDGAESLQHGSSVAAWFRAEVDRLQSLLSRGGLAAATMADGGVVVADLSARIDDAHWEELRAAMF